MCMWTVPSRQLTEVSLYHCTTLRYPDMALSRESSRLTRKAVLLSFNLMLLHARICPESVSPRMPKVAVSCRLS